MIICRGGIGPADLFPCVCDAVCKITTDVFFQDSIEESEKNLESIGKSAGNYNFPSEWTI